MRVLWLDVDDEPNPQSKRGFIERNAIGLLSGSEPASDTWLGKHTGNPRITNLWNVNHVQHRIEDGFLDEFSDLVELTVQRHGTRPNVVALSED